MVNENKNNAFAAVAGAVVGAGAAIVGAVLLADKKNQKKINEVIDKGQTLARNYVRDVNEKAQDTKNLVEKTVRVGKEKADKLIKVAKTAEKGVKNL